MTHEQMQPLVNAAELIFRLFRPGLPDKQYTFAASVFEGLIVDLIELYGALDGFADREVDQ